MKLIITGATGFVATEVVRQALLLPSITTVVAVARKAVSTPKGISSNDAAKLKSVVVPDYGTYSDETKKELAGAEACIWTVAITPSKAKAQDPELVRKVCQTWAIQGLKTMLEVNQNSAHPFRFLYMSGTGSMDPARPMSKDKKVWMPSYMVEYGKMRGETASQLFDIAEENSGRVDICIAKPGLITGKSNIIRGAFGTLIWLTGLVDTIHIKEVAAAMLHHAVNGFEGMEGVLTNAEMVKLGREIGPS